MVISGLIIRLVSLWVFSGVLYVFLRKFVSGKTYAKVVVGLTTIVILISLSTGYSSPKFTLQDESGVVVSEPSLIKNSRPEVQTDEQREKQNQLIYESNKP